MEKEFALETCKIGLLDVGIEEYLFNLEMIRDAAKLLDKKQSSRAYEYLSFIYDLANQYTFPLED